ncbi:MAG: hypothetical protein J3R72DRAFT_227215 [Linnemannia gamsii]|nr:MAG: hypothetical protein J3R72DRAFT_227215 [Linnemannia gamsii]
MSNRRATISSHPPAATATAAAMASHQHPNDGSHPNSANPVHTVAVALSSSHTGSDHWGYGHLHHQQHLYPSPTSATPASSNFSSASGDPVYGQSPPSHRSSFPPPSQHPLPLHHSHTRQSYPTYPSSLPADAFPRTLSQPANYDYDRARSALPTSPNSTLPRSTHSQYQIYQPSTHTTTPLSYPHAGHEHRPNYETKPFSGSFTSSSGDDYDRGISSTLPEYSYPMAPSHRLQHNPPRPHIRLQQPFQDQREQPSSYHHHHRHQQYAQYQDMPDSALRSPPKPVQFQPQQISPQSQPGQPHPPPKPPQPQEVPQRIPPPIRTRWSDDPTRDRPPPLSYPSGSNSTMSIHSANNRFSPSTPRTVHLSGSVLRQSSTDEYPMTESPLDFREMVHTQRTRVAVTRGKYDHGHDMEHCAEQDDEREREAEQDDDLDEMMLSPGKKQRLSNRSGLPTSSKYSNSGRKSSAPMEVDVEVGEYEDGQGSLASAHSSRIPSVSGSVQGDEKPSATKSKSSKTTASATPATQKRMQRHASDQMTLGEVIDKIDEEIHPEDEPQSLAGKGLRIYAQCVRRRVEARGSTSYNEVRSLVFSAAVVIVHTNVFLCFSLLVIECEYVACT